MVDPILACYLIFSMDATSCEEDYILPLVCILVKNNTYFRTLYQLYIFSHLFKFFHKWQECIATIPPIQCRGREIDAEKFNLNESIDSHVVMFTQSELLFTIMLKRQNGEVYEILVIFPSAFERVQLESDNKMHRMGDMISSTDSDMSSPGSFRASQDCIRLRLIAEVPTQDRGRQIQDLRKIL